MARRWQPGMVGWILLGSLVSFVVAVVVVKAFVAVITALRLRALRLVPDRRRSGGPGLAGGALGLSTLPQIADNRHPSSGLVDASFVDAPCRSGSPCRCMLAARAAPAAPRRPRPTSQIPPELTDPAMADKLGKMAGRADQVADGHAGRRDARRRSKAAQPTAADKAAAGPRPGRPRPDFERRSRPQVAATGRSMQATHEGAWSRRCRR